MKTLDFDAREFSAMGRSMLLLVWEKIKEAILCLPLFMYIIYYKKSIEIFGHSWHKSGKLSWKTVIVVISWQAAYRVYHSTVVTQHIETQVLGAAKYFKQFL